MARIHPKAKAVLKASLGLLLVVYMFHSRMVDLHSLRDILMAPLPFFTALAIILFSTVVSAERWKELARAQGFNFSFRTLFSLAMIGNFFNTFLPGAVGGDLVKAWYIAGEEPQRKSRAILTVLLDRVLGLSVILLYASVTVMFYLHWLDLHRELSWIAALLWGFTLAFVVVSALFFSPWVWKRASVKRLFLFAARRTRIEPLFQSMRIFSQSPDRFAKALFLSALSILATTFLFVFLGKALALQMGLAQYFFIVPLGLVFSAIPLLPGGVGTGQIAFYTLFLWMKIPHPEQGGTLCTLYQIYMILFSSIGGLFYLRFKSAANLVSSHAIPATSQSDESSTTKRRAVS